MRNTVAGLALALVIAGGGQAAAQSAFGPGFEKSQVAELWFAFGALSPPATSPDFDCYDVSPLAGNRYSVELNSRSFDAILEISRGRGCQSASPIKDDDSGDGSNARAEFIGDGGPWSIRARSFGAGSGAYSLTAKWEGAVAAVGSIRLGQSIDGTFAPGDATDRGAYYDCFRFSISAPRAVTARMTGGSPGQVSIYADAECRGEALDDAIAMPEANLQIDLPRAGEYSVRAHAMAIEAPGPYRLSLR